MINITLQKNRAKLLIDLLARAREERRAAETRRVTKLTMIVIVQKVGKEGEWGWVDWTEKKSSDWRLKKVVEETKASQRSSLCQRAGGSRVE